MANLKINLLPPELEEQKKKKSHQMLVATFSIGFLAVVVAFAAVVLAFRFSQGVILGKVKQDLDNAKTQVSSPDYKQKEGIVTSLKARLDSINSLLSQQTVVSYAYGLFNSLVPSDTKVTTILISSKGELKVSVESANIDNLTLFFNNLLDPTKNQQKITSVTIDNFGKSNSVNYKADLSIKLAGGGVSNSPPALPTIPAK
jgi:hypothetical protein